MANFYTTTADGNFSDAATWGKSSNSIATQGDVHATTNITPTTGGVNSAVFTAPNITGNKSIGCMIYVATKASTGSWTATLQEDSGAGFANVAGATANIAQAALLANQWHYFKWTTPYAYTVAAAGKYRIQVKVSSSSSGTAAADGAGTAIYVIDLNDIGGPPALGDRAFLLPANQSGTRTVTVTGTSGNNVGDSAVGQSNLPGQRTALCALHMSGLTADGSEGLLKWDTTASATLTVRGMINRYLGSEQRMGTVASPMPAGIIATLVYDQNGTEGTAGGRTWLGSRLILQGAPTPNTTDWKRSYVSGAGTTGSPLIISAGAAFSVNDQIMITSATTGQTEWKYIKTVNSSTSYVLSATAGGAESGLSFTHLTTDYVVTISRNVVVASNINSLGFFEYHGTSGNTTVGPVDVDWVRLETCGNSQTSKNGFLIQGNTGILGNIDYSVAWQPKYRSFMWSTCKAATTVTGLIATSGGGSVGASVVGALYLTSAGGKTFNDCFIVGCRRLGVDTSGASNLTFNRLVCNGNNLANTAPSSSGTGMLLVNTSAIRFNNCDVQGNLGSGIVHSGVQDATYSNCTIGNVSTNVIDIYATADTYTTATFVSSSFGSPTLLSNYLNGVPGSVHRFHRLNATDNKHYWYTAYGSAQSTGASLTDTTVRTPGSLGARLTPEDGTDGFLWQFYIPAKASSFVNFYGFFMLNAAFTGDASASARVEMWLPGSSVADATTTLSKATNNWQAVSLGALNSANVTDGLAQIIVYGITATAGAYVYADDFYNAGDGTTNSDKVTGLDTWLNGQPSPVITPQATSPADIWTYATSGLTTPGTTGKQLKDALTTGKFLGLK